VVTIDVTNNDNNLTRKEREEAFRRDLVLDAAESLFAEKGFDGTTVAEIAERSELAKGSLYHLFQSKEDIIAAIIHRKLDYFMRNLGDLLNSSASPIDKIKGFMRTKLMGVWESRHFARIFLYELRGFHWSTETPLMDEWRGQVESMMRSIEEVIAEAQRAKQIRSDLPTSIILSGMAGFSNAIIYSWLNTDQDFDVDVALDQALSLFLDGAMPPGEGD
jgi:AcrR family transcriptional regulator